MKTNKATIYKKKPALMKKIRFTRTKTLGKGGEYCDFHFFKK